MKCKGVGHGRGGVRGKGEMGKHWEGVWEGLLRGGRGVIKGWEGLLRGGGGVIKGWGRVIKGEGVIGKKVRVTYLQWWCNHYFCSNCSSLEPNLQVGPQSTEQSPW